MIKDSGVKSAVAGGGRYDKMIGSFLGSNKEYPAVGISFGIEPLFDALKLAKKVKIRKTVTQLYIIPIQTMKQSLDIAKKLREKGVSVDIDLMQRGISKNLAYANSMGIPYVAFIGGDELKQKKVKIRDMKSGREKMLKPDEIPSYIK